MHSPPHPLPTVNGQPNQRTFLTSPLRRTQIRPLRHTRPEAPTQHIHTTPTLLHRMPALPKSKGSIPDLPIISSIEDWAHLMQTHTPSDFASLANSYTNITGPTVLDCSGTEPITPAIIQHFVHGNWQNTIQVQECLTGIFRTLGIDPSISLLQQQEIDQMLCLKEAPRRWTRTRHFSARASYEDPSAIPICCGPWHNGAGHFVTFYISPDY